MQQFLKWFTTSNTECLIRLKQVSIVILIYIVSTAIRIENATFLNGDMGIIALMTSDAIAGRMNSWYFYGQSYFGSLQPILQSVLFRFHDLSIHNLMMLEHLWYVLGLVILIKTWSKNQFKYGVWPLLLLLTIPQFLYWSITPQGYGLIFLINIVLIAYTKTCTDLRSRYIQYLSIGLICGLALWFNTLLLIGVITAVIILFKQDDLKTKLISKIMYLNCGSFIGFAPLLLGYRETAGDNLAWFSRNAAGSSSLADSLEYFFNDLLFLQADPSQTLFSSSNSLDLSIYAMIIGLFSYSIYRSDRSTYTYLYFGIIVNTCFMILKSYKQDVQILEFVRYGFFGYTLLYFIAFDTLISLLTYRSAEIVNRTWMRLRLIAASSMIFALSIYGFGSAYKDITNKPVNTPTYELINSHMVDQDIRYVHCTEYFDVCGMLAYLNRDTGRHVFIQESPTSSRTPNNLRNFKKRPINTTVYEIIAKENLDPIESEATCFEWDGFTIREYCLMKSVFQKNL